MWQFCLFWEYQNFLKNRTPKNEYERSREYNLVYKHNWNQSYFSLTTILINPSKSIRKIANVIVYVVQTMKSHMLADSLEKKENGSNRIRYMRTAPRFTFIVLHNHTGFDAVYKGCFKDLSFTKELHIRRYCWDFVKRTRILDCFDGVSRLFLDLGAFLIRLDVGEYVTFINAHLCDAIKIFVILMFLFPVKHHLVTRHEVLFKKRADLTLKLTTNLWLSMGGSPLTL